MEEADLNKIIEANDGQQEEPFHYNFLNIPWDDRSKKSKVGIVALLIAIFVATMSCVIHNFVLHYRGFTGIKNNNNTELGCFKLMIDDHLFVARIHSVATQDLLCVGAVVGSTSVLADGVCVKAGPIRMYLGNTAYPPCKKGFSVDVIEPIFHDGVVSKRLVLLSSYDNIAECSEIIRIGQNLDWNLPVKIIGRPSALTERFLSGQHVNLGNSSAALHGETAKNINLKHTICAEDTMRCPVRAGDLMLQNNMLFGLAATSVHRNRVACFCNISIIKRDLKELDAEIEI